MSAIDLNIRTPRGVLACVFVAVMWTVFLSSALAQMTITGRFSGTVLDTSGAAIPGVIVAVVNLVRPYQAPALPTRKLSSPRVR